MLERLLPTIMQAPLKWPKEPLGCHEAASLAETKKLVSAVSFLNAARLNSFHNKKFHSAEETPVQVQSPLGGKRCLVLDDEFLITLDIQQILELAGAAHVASAATASEALALLRSEPRFDVAVLDVKLSGPDQNSLGVATALSEKGTPFVFLTGTRVDNPHAKQFPKAPVIEKPYDALALLDAVRRAIAAV